MAAAQRDSDKCSEDEARKGLEDGSYVLQKHVVQTKKNHKPSQCWKYFQEICKKDPNPIGIHECVGYVQCTYDTVCKAIYSISTSVSVLDDINGVQYI